MTQPRDNFEHMGLNTADLARHMAMLRALGVEDWSTDTVTSEHLFQDPRIIVATGYIERMAFNYDLMDGKEVHFVHHEEGESVHFLHAPPAAPDQLVPRTALLYLGYRVVTLQDALRHWALAGQKILQVSQTVHHSGTVHRYRHAFVDTRELFGCYVKIAQRLTEKSDAASLARGREEYTWLEAQL